MNKNRSAIALGVLLFLCGCRVTDDSRLVNESAPVPVIRADAGSSISPGEITVPVIFVHGVSSIGGDTFYNMYEKFASWGYGHDMMRIPLLPRIGVGSNNPDYAWYSPLSALLYNEAHWQSNYINCDTLKDTVDQLLPLSSGRVDLVGHSNGTAVILKFLARYPEYGERIRKVVFISGFADVSGANGFDNIVSDLHNTMPFDKLPAGIEYYALSSESDANIDASEMVYGIPYNSNPYPFQDTIRFWHMDSGDEINETNFNITGRDHQEIVTGSESIAMVFEWLTGHQPPATFPPESITIGGRIVLAGGEYGYHQEPVGSGTVRAEYYDPDTGMETSPAGVSMISSTGRYSITGLDTASYLKLTISANGGCCVYFLANMITHDNDALDFKAPRPIISDRTYGSIGIHVLCRYSYLSYYRYGKRKGDQFSGMIEAPGCNVRFLDSTCLPDAAPSSYLSINLKNYGICDSVTGNSTNFDPLGTNDYRSKDVFFTVDLNSTGRKTRVRIHGDDRKNNIDNYIMYLYRE